jgi:hypothetical protein
MPDTNLSPQVSGRGWFARLAWPLLALGMISCGNGDVITKRVELPEGLQVVDVYDNVDLQLVQDAQTFAEVRAGEKVIDDIKCVVSGKKLTISNTSSYNWTRSYDTPRELVLHVPSLKTLFHHGQGNITSASQFRQDTLFLHLVGAGDINLDIKSTYLNMDMFELGDMTLRGEVDIMGAEVGGNGRLFANGLRSRTCYFKTTRDSNGDAWITALDVFGCRAAGTGTVYYAGPPRATDIQVSGRGQVLAQ